MRYSEPKTKKSVRSIALDERMLAILRAHMAAQAVERLAALLGHSSIGITYSHLLPGTQEEAASLVAGILFVGRHAI